MTKCDDQYAMEQLRRQLIQLQQTIAEAYTFMDRIILHVHRLERAWEAKNSEIAAFREKGDDQ